MSATTSPVDEILPAPRLFVLGIQHVLVMYAGAVAVPLIIGGALGLAPEQRALLIRADLFACGLATLVQSLGFPGVGIRLPVMMGVTFASVAPMLAMVGAARAAVGATFQPADALLTIYGAVIAAGVFGIIVAPFVSRMLPAFPPLVTGSVILVIGVSLMRIGINWAGGGLPMLTKVVDGVRMQVPNPAYGAPADLLIALFVLLVILGIVRWGRGFVANIAVLLGTIAGGIVAASLGRMSFAGVAAAGWVAPIIPFQFGVPAFHIVPIATMCLVMVVVMIESTGMFLAVGAMTGKPIDQPALARGLRADGVGTILGGIFNTFPYTSFSQNVGLVGVTGIRSRFVTVAGGAIMVVLGLIPKLGAIVAAVPLFVLGGAGVVMFGMVAATGIRILAQVDFATRRHNLFIVAISLGIGMIPLIAENFFAALPRELKPLLDSGILLASIVAVALNAFFNGLEHSHAHAAQSAALSSEH
jgi:NCS2 family nucleobase:cation symporter-2